MNDSSKIKLLTGTTVLLILLNVAIVSFMWLAPHPPRPDRAGGPASIIIRELNFNDVQRQQFEKLKEEHQHIMRSTNEKERHTHDALSNLIREGQDSTAASDSLINEIIQDKKRIEIATFHHLAEVRKICRPEQQKKFDNIIINLFARRPEGPPTPPGQ